VFFAANKMTSKRKMLKEAIITLFFLRPAVDAHRVCTNYNDDEHNVVGTLDLMLMNKGIELATEARSQAAYSRFTSG